MAELLKVENDTLVRDIRTSAILETDSKKLRRHREIKRSMSEKEKRIDMLIARINKLEQTIEVLAKNV